MGTKEAAQRWGYTEETIRKWCRSGMLKTAEQDKKGSPWRISVNEKCPKKIKQYIGRG